MDHVNQTDNHDNISNNGQYCFESCDDFSESCHSFLRSSDNFLRSCDNFFRSSNSLPKSCDNFSPSTSIAGVKGEGFFLFSDFSFSYFNIWLNGK